MIAVDMQRVLKTGIALSTEKSKSKLLELIITEAMQISNADAGTLYLYSRQLDALQFKIMCNNTLKTYKGGKDDKVDLPPVEMSESNVCTYCALKRINVNIADVYNCDEFDFSGPKKYDSLTGYHTKSMMVIPFANTMDEIIGVLQLINAQDENNNIIPFSRELEIIISALASQAAVAITNANYLKDIKNLFQSFVKVMISAIDELSPYNVNHTRRVAEYCDSYTDYLNLLYQNGSFNQYFSDSRREQLVMAAWMHDIGKVVTPIEIMNKETRLGKNEGAVMSKLELALATLRIRFLEEKLTAAEYEQQKNAYETARKLIMYINCQSYLPNEDYIKLCEIKDLTYYDLENIQHKLLSDNDFKNLSIKQGTLTDEERDIMEGHVRMTSKLLDNINFSSDMREVPKFAGMHHELLNGSGYPLGLKGEEIPFEARILSVIDVFEALTSVDRPYKKPMEKQQAFEIITEMAVLGKLDNFVVKSFIQSIKHSE